MEVVFDGMEKNRGVLYDGEFVDSCIDVMTKAAPSRSHRDTRSQKETTRMFGYAWRRAPL
jgi:hypothetical protein